MYNFNRKHSARFILKNFDEMIESSVIINAFNYLFEHYTKEIEKEALMVLWKYYGGMFPENNTGIEETAALDEAFKINREKALELNVSDDFMEYMSKAFKQ